MRFKRHTPEAKSFLGRILMIRNLRTAEQLLDQIQSVGNSTLRWRGQPRPITADSH